MIPEGSGEEPMAPSAFPSGEMPIPIPEGSGETPIPMEPSGNPTGQMPIFIPSEGSGITLEDETPILIGSITDDGIEPEPEPEYTSEVTMAGAEMTSTVSIRENITVEVTGLLSGLAEQTAIGENLLAGMNSSDPNYAQLSQINGLLGSLADSFNNFLTLRRRRSTESECSWLRSALAFFEEQVDIIETVIEIIDSITPDIMGDTDRDQYLGSLKEFLNEIRVTIEKNIAVLNDSIARHCSGSTFSTPPPITIETGRKNAKN